MLGIGANVVVFGLVNAVLLHPLEVSDPQNLYQLRFRPWTSFKLLTTSYPAFEDYRQRHTTFGGIAGYYGWSQARLRWDKAVLNVSGYAVTGNYFDLLGVQPEVGRFIQAADEHGAGQAPPKVCPSGPPGNPARSSSKWVSSNPARQIAPCRGTAPVPHQSP
jgi:hypothetical protein